MHLCYYMRRIHARICSRHVSSSSYNTRTCIHVHTHSLSLTHTTDHATRGYGDMSNVCVRAHTHTLHTHPHLQYSTWLRGNEIKPHHKGASVCVFGGYVCTCVCLGFGV
jgi:hypothetical protein